MRILSRFRRQTDFKLLTPAEFGNRILASRAAIIEEYVRNVRRLVPGAAGLSDAFLRDHLPAVLDEMAEFLRHSGSEVDSIETSWLASQHGLQRAESSSYTLTDLRKEFRILRHAILRQVAAHERLSVEANVLLIDVYEATLTKSAEVFVRNSASELLQHRIEQRKSAMELREAQTQRASSDNQHRWFEQAMNRLPKPLFIVDMRARRISFANHAARKMLDLDGSLPGPIDEAEMFAGATDAIGKPLAADQTPTARTFRGEVIHGEELILTTTTGRYHLKIYSEQIPASFDEPASALILFQDITLQKTTETDLRKAQSDLHEAVEIAQVGFWHLDVATQKIKVTDILLKKFGIDPRTFKGTLAEAIGVMHPGDRERVSAAIKKAIETDQPYHVEYRVVHPDGKTRWIEAKGTSAYDRDGAASRFTGTTIDVTERKSAEEATARAGEIARAERAKYEEVLNQAVIPIALLEGPAHRLAFANAAFRTTFNPPSPEDGAALPAAAELLDRVYRSGEACVGRDQLFRRVDARGQTNEIYFDFTFAAKKDASNEIAGVLAVMADVTDKVVARRSLEVEQNKFKTIFADAATSMALLRGPDAVYEIANPSYLALFNDRDLIGSALLEALPELAGQTFPERAKGVYETGVPYVDREAVAYLRRTSDGLLEERYFDQAYTRVLDEHGAPYGIFIQAREVTHFVFARRALERSSERYRIAVETANMGTWEVDPRTRVGRWSARTREIFGLGDADEAPLQSAIERIHPDDRERAAAAIEAAMDPRGEGSYDIAYRILHENGGVRWVSALGKAYFADGPDGREPTLFMGNVLDVTDEALAEAALKEAKDRAERASAAKSQFLANMSHEIRTPLGAIMGFASLLKDPSLGRQEQDGFISVIERNSTQLLRIIDDILDLSKVEAGMMLIERIDFSLPEMLTDFSSLMGFKAREKGIDFSSRAGTPLPKIINSDPTRLRQILMNVVGNAIKFTDAGRVELRCSYEDQVLTFEVEDTGRGVSPEQARSLFQPFTQADTSITRKYGGTGLGLALARSLAEAFGGRFTLERSELGKGSMFSIRIKVLVDPEADFVHGLGFEPTPMRSVINLGQLAGLKVLLVEDSPDNQALISIFLGRAGARADIASDGEQGYAMALRGDYDIVLMDVQMPVMDGISAIRRLRAEGFAKPVIALTAHAMKEERIRCLSAGFTDFLSKPVAREELIAAILRQRK